MLRKPVIDLGTYLMIGVLAIIISARYVSLEHSIYVWDYGNYWNQFRDWGQTIGNGKPWVREAATAIGSSEYNPLAAILLYPVFALWGGDRGVYVSAVAVVYLVPAAIVAAKLAASTGAVAGRSQQFFVLLLAVLFVPFWAPTVRGMVDVVGLVPLGLATLLIAKPKPLTRNTIWFFILAGLLLWAAFALRRWYAYSVVAIFIVFAAFQAADAFRRQPRLSQFIRAMLPVLVMTVSFLAPLLLLQREVLFRALTTDYSVLHSSYASPFLDQIKLASLRLGLIASVLALVGAAIAVKSRNRSAAFCGGVAALSFVLFVRTQGMGLHHFLPTAFFLFPLIVLALSMGRGRAIIVALPFATLMLVYCLFPVFETAPKALSATLPARVQPLRLSQIEEYRRLISDLKAAADPSSKIAVYASQGLVMADDLLVNLDPELKPKLFRVGQDAMRSAYSFEMVRSKLAVVVDPPQAHLTGSQEHLLIPNRLIQNKQGLGKAYRRLSGPYKLESNATATIYSRVSPIASEDMSAYIDELWRIYPHWKKDKQKVLSAALALREENLGDRYGTVAYAGLNYFQLHPGMTQDTAIRFTSPQDGNPAKLLLSLRGNVARCPKADGVTVSVRVDGEAVAEQTLEPGGKAAIDLTLARGQQLELIVDKRDNPQCDLVSVRFVPE